MTGKIKYPYTPDGKTRLPNCEGPDFDKNPKCKFNIGEGIATTKWVNTTVTCPTAHGKTESRPLTELSGYPNPMFSHDQYADSVSRRNYDITVWNFADPFLDTPVAEMNFDTEALHAMWGPNRFTCQSFGYGRDNQDKTGTLRGANTPLSATWDSYVRANTKEMGAAPISSIGRTAPGDSGGPLFCKDLDGTVKLFGVTSRGSPEAAAKPEAKQRQDFDEMAPTPLQNGDVSIYSLPSWNKDWIQLVLEKAPLTRSANIDDWFSFTLDYQVGEVQKVANTVDQCIQKNRRKMGADYKTYIQGHRRLLGEMDHAFSEYQKYENDSGLYLMLIRKPYDELRQMLFACSKLYE